MFRFAHSPLACGMMAATLLSSSMAMAQQDPLGAPRGQRGDVARYTNDSPQPRSSVGVNHSQHQQNVQRTTGSVNHTQRVAEYSRDGRNDGRWNNDRNDHRWRGRDRDDRWRYDNDRHYHSNSGSRVIVNVNRNYPAYYYDDYYYAPRPVYYEQRYPSPYYTSSYYSQRMIPVVQESPYVEVRCGSQPIIGTVVGGVAGGLVGNQFGKGSGRTAMTIGGALLGLVVGNSVDRANESCAYQALEYGQTNTQVTWVNPNDDYAYTVIPGEISKENGRYCREYQAKVMVGGALQDGYGRACRQPDGSWEIVDGD